MNEQIISIGDVCTYSYDNSNTSFSIVEVVKELSDEVAVVKFHQVIRDDSGNDYFTYLCNTGKTMNVSRKYLTKIKLIDRQKAEIKRLNIRNKTLSAITTNYDWKFSKAKFEAYKEFAKMLKKRVYSVAVRIKIDNLLAELTNHKQTVSMIDGHIEE